MKDFLERAKKIEKILLDLGQVIIPWAQEQRLNRPIDRIIQRFATRAGSDPMIWQDQFGELLLLYYSLNTPGKIKMILKAERDDEFPRKFSGDELQMLNNLLHYQPLFARFFTLQEEMHSNIYHVSEVISGYDYVVANPQLREAVETNRTLILAVLVPIGNSPRPADHPADIPWEDVPGYIPLGQFAAFGAYSESDLEYFANALAGRPLPRDKFGPFVGEHFTEFMFLSGLPTPDQDNPQLAQRIFLADFTTPEPGLKNLEVLEESFVVQRKADWFHGHALLTPPQPDQAPISPSVENEDPHSLEFYYNKKNRRLIIRAVEYDAFLAAIQILEVKSLALPPKIDACLGIVSAAQLLLDHPFPGDFIAKEFEID